jgi:hypothetical protein
MLGTTWPIGITMGTAAATRLEKRVTIDDLGE